MTDREAAAGLVELIVRRIHVFEITANTEAVDAELHRKSRDAITGQIVKIACLEKEKKAAEARALKAQALVAEAKADAKASFNHGVIFAAYHAARAHGEDTIAEELLNHIGIETVKELKAAGGQTCDVQALRHLLKRARS